MSTFRTVDNTLDNVLLFSPQILCSAVAMVLNVEFVNLNGTRRAPTFRRSLRMHD
jgi:hypothetical protein